MHINLRRGQADAVGVVHGFEHVGNQRADACIHRLNRFGDGMEFGVGVSKNV